MKNINFLLKTIGWFLFVLLGFFYLTGLKFLYPPYYSVIPLFIFGIIIFFKSYEINREYLTIIFIILIIVFMNIISMMYNQVFFIDYIKQIPFLFSINFFAAYFLIFIYLKFSRNKHSFIYLIVLSLILQLILSFCTYLSTPIYNHIFSIVDSNLDASQAEDFNSARIVGVGASFFGAGVLNCAILILLTIFYQKKIIQNHIFYILSFLVISVLGLMLSRTTAVGIILSLIILLINLNKFGSIKFFSLMFIIVLCAILSIPFINLYNDRIINIFKFGFEFIYNFEDSQAKDSIGRLREMLEVFPTNISTWLIGDAQYINESGGYYKNIDVGFTRIIYASGLIGLFLYIYIHFYLIKINNLFSGYKIYLYILFLILNVKGVANLFPILILLYFYKREVLK